MRVARTFCGIQSASTVPGAAGGVDAMEVLCTGHRYLPVEPPAWNLREVNRWRPLVQANSSEPWWLVLGDMLVDQVLLD